MNANVLRRLSPAAALVCLALSIPDPADAACTFSGSTGATTGACPSGVPDGSQIIGNQFLAPGSSTPQNIPTQQQQQQQTQQATSTPPAAPTPQPQPQPAATPTTQEAPKPAPAITSAQEQATLTFWTPFGSIRAEELIGPLAFLLTDEARQRVLRAGDPVRNLPPEPPYELDPLVTASNMVAGLPPSEGFTNLGAAAGGDVAPPPAPGPPGAASAAGGPEPSDIPPFFIDTPRMTFEQLTGRPMTDKEVQEELANFLQRVVGEGLSSPPGAPPGGAAAAGPPGAGSTAEGFEPGAGPPSFIGARLTDKQLKQFTGKSGSPARPETDPGNTAGAFEPGAAPPFFIGLRLTDKQLKQFTRESGSPARPEPDPAIQRRILFNTVFPVDLKTGKRKLGDLFRFISGIVSNLPWLVQEAAEAEVERLQEAQDKEPAPPSSPTTSAAAGAPDVGGMLPGGTAADFGEALIGMMRAIQERFGAPGGQSGTRTAGGLAFTPPGTAAGGEGAPPPAPGPRGGASAAAPGAPGAGGQASAAQTDLEKEAAEHVRRVGELRARFPGGDPEQDWVWFFMGKPGVSFEQLKGRWEQLQGRPMTDEEVKLALINYSNQVNWEGMSSPPGSPGAGGQAPAPDGAPGAPATPGDSQKDAPSAGAAPPGGAGAPGTAGPAEGNPLLEDASKLRRKADDYAKDAADLRKFAQAQRELATEEREAAKRIPSYRDVGLDKAEKYDAEAKRAEQIAGDQERKARQLRREAKRLEKTAQELEKFAGLLGAAPAEGNEDASGGPGAAGPTEAQDAAPAPQTDLEKAAAELFRVVEEGRAREQLAEALKEGARRDRERASAYRKLAEAAREHAKKLPTGRGLGSQEDRIKDAEKFEKEAGDLEKQADYYEGKAQEAIRGE